MKAITLLTIAGLMGIGLPQAFAQTDPNEPAVVYAAPAVVYQAPVVYEGPVIYYGPVIYAAPVVYANPSAYEMPVVYSAIAPGSDMGGYYSTYSISPNVTIVGEPGNYEGGYYYYPNTCNQVIYFGGRQAATQGYSFGYGR